MIACLFSFCIASDSIAVNDLNKIRTSFNQEQKKIRIVFDATKKIDYKKFWLALTELWELKKQLSNKITNDNIETIFSLAKDNGAYGGKLLGAGAGGFILFLFPTNKKKAFMKKIPKLLHVPFKLENTGSQIIYNNRNN